MFLDLLTLLLNPPDTLGIIIFELKRLCLNIQIIAVNLTHWGTN